MGAERPATRAATALKILLVDDNQDAAEMLGEVLRELGHEVVVGHDGPRALRLAQEFGPTVALLDIGLPGMDGYELARRLRAEHPGLHLVAITGYGQDRDRIDSRRAGFDAHLVKPVELGALNEALAFARAGARS